MEFEEEIIEEVHVTGKPGEFDTPADAPMPLGKNNLIAMAIAGALIVLGFILMLGGSTTAESFNADIFSTRRIIVGPCIALIGFIAMGAAIIIDPKRFNKK